MPAHVAHQNACTPLRNLAPATQLLLTAALLRWCGRAFPNARCLKIPIIPTGPGLPEGNRPPAGITREAPGPMKERRTVLGKLLEPRLLELKRRVAGINVARLQIRSVSERQTLSQTPREGRRHRLTALPTFHGRRSLDLAWWHSWDEHSTNAIRTQDMPMIRHHNESMQMPSLASPTILEGLAHFVPLAGLKRVARLKALCHQVHRSRFGHTVLSKISTVGQVAHSI